jgi:CO/xanthine dehydrogenase Mo-binding subunit
MTRVQHKAFQFEQSRRDFLRSTGVLAVTITIPGSFAWPAHGASEAGDPPIDRVGSYLAIDEDGGVTVFTGRMDMGTGNRTCFAQFVADELDVDISRIRVIAGDTALTPDGGKTTASDAITIGGQPIRVSAAVARKHLVDRAAERLDAEPVDLSIENGTISVAGDPSRSVTYGELVGGQRLDIPLIVSEITASGPLVEIPEGVSLKTPEQFRYIGTSVPRIDLAERVIAGNFCQKVRVPGMLHARMIFPDAPGARLLDVDMDSVRDIPGLVQVYRRGDLLAVICEREEQAIRAMERLTVTWSEGRTLPGTDGVSQAIRSQPGIEDQMPRDDGDVETALADAAQVLEATYELPFYNHAMIAPTCAVADYRDERLTIWSGTQWPRQTQRDIAQMLGMPVDNVHVIWVEESGSFGRLAAADAAFDAALLSREVGRPVRVQWTRQQEFRWQPHQPPMVFDLRAGIDADGNLAAWDSEQWVSSTRESARFNGLAWILIGEAPGNDELRGGLGNISYASPNKRMQVHYVEPILRGLYFRSPGGFQGTFAFESFIDELAVAAGADPIEFRLRHLEDERAAAVLRRAAERSGWQPRVSGSAVGSGRLLTGRGVGLTASGTKVAAVVDVEIDRETGEIRVPTVAVAHDVGLVVNPDGLTNQIEQAIVQGVGRTLMEEVRIDERHVVSEDWASYPVIRFSQVPEVHVDLIDRPDIPPGGAGEPATNVPPAAIANAVFDATGIRFRRLPLTPERLKAALAQQT